MPALRSSPAVMVRRVGARTVSFSRSSPVFGDIAAGSVFACAVAAPGLAHAISIPDACKSLWITIMAGTSPAFLRAPDQDIVTVTRASQAAGARYEGLTPLGLS